LLTRKEFAIELKESVVEGFNFESHGHEASASALHGEASEPLPGLTADYTNVYYTKTPKHGPNIPKSDCGRIDFVGIILLRARRARFSTHNFRQSHTAKKGTALWKQQLTSAVPSPITMRMQR
jgi:hypothetical protein